MWLHEPITAVASTTDLWSSRTMELYRSMKVHYNDDGFCFDAESLDRAVDSAKSWQRKKQLAEAQRELKLPEQALKTECPQGGDQGRP